MAADLIVHVVDDDDAARDSLVFLLQASEFSVRGHASAAAFLEDFNEADAGCVITDVRMPDIDGVELLRRVRTGERGVPVIVITGHGDVQLAVEAIKAGAIDFIEKPFDHETLLGAVRRALGGSVGDAAQGSEVEERLTSLSPTERQVLRALAAGQSNKAIALELRIDMPVVEIHRANLMTKMGARSVSHLVRMMLLAGPSSS